MKTKVCNKCKERKGTKSFNYKRKSGKDNFQPYCKVCQSSYQKSYYKYDRTQVKKINENRKIRKKTIHKFLADFFASNPCIDCEKKKLKARTLLKNKVSESVINKMIATFDSDIRNLTFDHIRGHKEFNIADAIRNVNSLSLIKKEMKKCVVRCHNCHDIATVRRSKNWRYKEHYNLTK